MGRSVAEILSGGPTAAKFRDFLGQTVTVVDYLTVATSRGEAVQLVIEVDGEQQTVWAPSIVATQVKELAAEGHLPIPLRFEERESIAGNRYYTLAEPPAGSLPMPGPSDA
jgi:hypothetical protein